MQPLLRRLNGATAFRRPSCLPKLCPGHKHRRSLISTLQLDIAKKMPTEAEIVARHAATEAPTADVPKPPMGEDFQLDPAIAAALPVKGSTVVQARRYGNSLFGRGAKLTAKLPDDTTKRYFVKMVSLGDTGRRMIAGEFESLKAIYASMSSFVPEPHAIGVCNQMGEETHFLLEDFREVGRQPPDPVRFGRRLAEMHKQSVSPTGKFGFHVNTCQGSMLQNTDRWEESWARFYRKHWADVVEKVKDISSPWPEFYDHCDLITEKVIPRLLEPLQAKGRTIKPSICHGDLWDENSATDLETGEPFIFDAGSFYAHNEYDLGNWRPARHRLSNKDYFLSYKRNYPASEPEAEWDDRNLLYCLRFDLVGVVLVPGCNLRGVVLENMKTLCKSYCPQEFAQVSHRYSGLAKGSAGPTTAGAAEDEEEEEEEEEPL